MDIKLHKTATTTPRIRREIQQAPASISDSELAPRYRVSCPTIARWRYRETQHDLPHTRHNLLTTLSPAQEEIVVALREYLRLSVDDLLVVARIPAPGSLAFRPTAPVETSWLTQSRGPEKAGESGSSSDS